MADGGGFSGVYPKAPRYKGVIVNAYSGIWNSYGCIPKVGESISISLEDTAPSGSVQYESMIDAFGFEKDVKDIGKIADTKTISELIVMLPFVYSTGSADSSPPTDDPILTDTPTGPELSSSQINPCDPCIDPCQELELEENSDGSSTTDYVFNRPGIGQAYDPVNGWERFTGDWYDEGNSNFSADSKIDISKFYYSNVEKAYLFKISETLVNKILGIPDYKQLSIYQIAEILNNKENIDGYNTVAKLMLMMTKYNFPPHLNWLKNKNIPPVVIYCAEFKHILSKEDLSNIWQGSMPNIAINPRREDSEDDYEIEHSLNDEELFAGYDIVNEEMDIKLKVFKAKLRANNDYERDIKGIGEFDNRTDDSDWYQYNWPYDYFSLVELFRIDAGEIYEKE